MQSSRGPSGLALISVSLGAGALFLYFSRARRDSASKAERKDPVSTSRVATSPLPSSRNTLPRSRSFSADTHMMDAITEVTEYSDIFDGMNVVVVGIAGGTGSGKSTLARAIRQGLPESEIAYLSHDNYYKDISGLSFEMRASHNFDHPDALDTDLMYEHVMKLKDGIEISMPTYDFGTHKRMETSVRVHPCKVILVEGILIFTHEKLRDALDVKIFVDTADDIRLIRRLERDMQERKRSAVSVVNQYKKTVRPMHKLFVEPTKAHANVIVPDGLNDVALDLIVSRLRFAINK